MDGATLFRMTLHGLVAAVLTVGSMSVAHAQVPTAKDIAACNTEAQQAARKGAASKDTAEPNTKDHSRAAEAHRPESSASRAEDPQLGGMDAEGAKDPAYQAAYRTCMRKAGF
jgi:hypothetical protein